MLARGHEHAHREHTREPSTKLQSQVCSVNEFRVRVDYKAKQFDHVALLHHEQCVHVCVPCMQACVHACVRVCAHAVGSGEGFGLLFLATDGGGMASRRWEEWHVKQCRFGLLQDVVGCCLAIGYS